MLRLVVKASIAWKRKAFPIVLLRNSVHPSPSNFPVSRKYTEVCSTKLGTIDEYDQNLQTVPKRHIFQDPAFSWLLDK